MGFHCFPTHRHFHPAFPQRALADSRPLNLGLLRIRPKHFPHYLDLFNGSQRVEIILILFGLFSPLYPTSICLSLSFALSVCLSVCLSACLSLSTTIRYIHYNTTALTLRREYTLFNHVVISLNACPRRDRIHQNV